MQRYLLAFLVLTTLLVGCDNQSDRRISPPQMSTEEEQQKPTISIDPPKRKADIRPEIQVLVADLYIRMGGMSQTPIIEDGNFATLMKDKIAVFQPRDGSDPYKLSNDERGALAQVIKMFAGALYALDRFPDTSSADHAKGLVWFKEASSRIEELLPNEAFTKKLEPQVRDEIRMAARVHYQRFAIDLKLNREDIPSEWQKEFSSFMRTFEPNDGTDPQKLTPDEKQVMSGLLLLEIGMSKFYDAKRKGDTRAMEVAMFDAVEGGNMVESILGETFLK